VRPRSSNFWRVARKQLEKLTDGAHGEEAVKVVAAVAAAGAVAAVGKAGWDRFASRSNGGEPHAFRLDPGEPLPDALRGVLEGQVERAASHLESTNDESPDEAVHQARKAFKRSRAALRLAREELGPDAFARENRRYRDLGRELAGARDADVLIETLDGIAAPAGREVGFAGLREILVTQRDAERGALIESEDARAGALERLAAARAAIAELPLEHQSSKRLVAGLRRTYRDGRRAAKKARGSGDTEALHEWRKRVKDLWHQCQVLTPLWPKRMKEMTDAAHDLSDLLGEDHDLAVLGETAHKHRRSMGKEERRVLERAIRRRRRKLQRAADRAGAKLYAERPGRLAARLQKRARKALA
jgi:CHAD domain-containing protein